MKRILHFYLFLLYNAYWSSIDMGEKHIPKENAILYMVLTKFCLLTGTVYLLKAFSVLDDIKLPTYLVIGIIVLVYAISLKKFESQVKNYEFISRKKKKNRLQLFFSLISISWLYFIIGLYLFICSP